MKQDGATLALLSYVLSCSNFWLLSHVIAGGNSALYKQNMSANL